MNHKDDCDRTSWHYSGKGYNRVKICACGAEDHAPESFSTVHSLGPCLDDTPHQWEAWEMPRNGVEICKCFKCGLLRPFKV
jgi:hypothetical protein